MLRLITVLAALTCLILGSNRSGITTATGGGAQPAPQDAGSYVLRVEDGTVMRLGGPDSVAVLSPDGAMAAVATRSGPDAGMRVVELATGRVSVPLASEAGQVSMPVWSPDGRLLAFRFDRFGRPDPAAVPPSGLYIIDPHTRETVQVLRDPPSSWTWAPDSRSITGVTFETGDVGIRFNIVGIDIVTGDVAESVLEQSASICPTGLTWSPDGRWLAFASGSFQQACGDMGAFGLWLWSADSRKLQQLTSGAVYVLPAWTADGRVLALRLPGAGLPGPQPGPPRPAEIVVVSIDGVEELLGTIPPLTFPYEPYQETAGGVVTFGLAGCGEGAVFAADLAGGAARRLSGPAVAAASPKLAPDGLRVAWVAFRPDKSDLQLAATDGSTVRTVLQDAPGLQLSGWSGDSRLLSFTVGTPALVPCPGEAASASNQ